MPARHPSAALSQPVAYPLAAPSRVRAALGMLVGAAVVLQLVWWHASAPAWWQQLLALLSCVLAACAVCCLPLWPDGTLLQWSGSKWRLHGAAAQAQETPLLSLAVMADGQSWLLVCARALQPPGQARWLWLARTTNPERWPDIRRVLYSSIAADQHNIPAV